MLGGEAGWDDPLSEHAEFLREFVATQGVQTNEVQRSWVLVPLLLRVAQRTGAETFDLVELGPSAGLNLVWDRYRYRYEAGDWGREDAVLRFEGEERRAVPGELLGLEVEVRGRTGIDRSPIDVTTEEGARLLRSFVWAGQEGRMERLDRAIEALREDPPQLVTGDYVDELPDVLAGQPRDGLTVVFQTASFGYIGDEGRARVRAVLEEAGRERSACVHLDGQAARPGGALLGPAARLLAGRGARVRRPCRLPRLLAAMGAVTRPKEPCPGTWSTDAAETAKSRDLVPGHVRTGHVVGPGPETRPEGAHR